MEETASEFVPDRRAAALGVLRLWGIRLQAVVLALVAAGTVYAPTALNVALLALCAAVSVTAGVVIYQLNIERQRSAHAAYLRDLRDEIRDQEAAYVAAERERVHQAWRNGDLDADFDERAKEIMARHAAESEAFFQRLREERQARIAAYEAQRL